MNIQFKPKSGSRGIEWCDETRNATGGCMHGCQCVMPDGTIIKCYAEEIAEHSPAKQHYPEGFEHHYFRPQEVLKLPARNEPRLIFVDSMSDMFASNVPEEHVLPILDAMWQAPQHVYMSLTKAAPQLLKYVGRIPPNLWVGVSSPPDWFMGNQLSPKRQEAMLRRGLEVLHEVKNRTGNIVWMSAEPVSWDLTAVIDKWHPLDWIVIGAASHGRQCFQPDPSHISAVLEMMDLTDTPVFYKGNIQQLFSVNDLGSAEFNRWREDFPECYRSGEPIAAVARRQQRCREYGWTLSRSYRPRPSATTPISRDCPAVSLDLQFA